MSDNNKFVQLQKLIDDIVAEQEKISVELTNLRSQGKGKTVQFRQLFSKKLFNIQVISLLQSYGLWEN
jgi:hypothetical protein